jgi:CheY-like chemotaxis protein
MAEIAPTDTTATDAPLVLIVEDDAAVRSTLAAILRDEGCDIIIAPNGFDALVALEQHDPDVIVLDWMMPVVDGQHFLGALRTEYGRQTPVLVISAGRVNEEMAMRFGAAAYLQKPFDLDDLMRMLNDLIDRRNVDGSRPPRPNGQDRT